MSANFSPELTWKNSRNNISRYLVYWPIVVHILVNDGQVLKNKTQHLAWNQQILKTSKNLSINRFLT
jgi:hypothetical protein